MTKEHASETGADTRHSQAFDPVMAALYLRVLGGDLGAAQVWLDVRVLDRYRAQQERGTRVIRTDSAGRVKADEWSLDFGIAGHGDAMIHASAADLAQRLPVGERAHWAQHAAPFPASRNFLAMRLHPSSCFDDGEVREWTADPTSSP